MNILGALVTMEVDMLLECACANVNPKLGPTTAAAARVVAAVATTDDAEEPEQPNSAPAVDGFASNKGTVVVDLVAEFVVESAGRRKLPNPTEGIGSATFESMVILAGCVVIVVLGTAVIVVLKPKAIGVAAKPNSDGVAVACRDDACVASSFAVVGG